MIRGAMVIVFIANVMFIPLNLVIMGDKPAAEAA